MTVVLTLAVLATFVGLIVAPPLGAIALAFLLLGVLLFDDSGAGTSLDKRKDRR